MRLLSWDLSPLDTFDVATGSEQAFSKDAQTRVAFQAKARKLLAEVEKLNKQERQLRQKGVDLRIVTALPSVADLSCKTQHQAQRPSSNHTPRLPPQTAAALLEAKAAAASLLSKAPAPATWYSDLITPTPAPKRRAPMRPPSPRPLRSLRNTRRQSENANSDSGDIPAVAKHGHVTTDEAPGPGLRTRAQRRAALKLSPGGPATSHDTASAGLDPPTPPPRHLGTDLCSLQQPEDHAAAETETDFWADEENGQTQVNGSVHVDLPPVVSEPPLGLDCSPHLTSFAAPEARTTPWSSPTVTPVQCQMDATAGYLPTRSPLQGASWGALQDPMVSPAMRAACSGLDLSRLDDSAVALSPITSGLSPLTLGLADFPSPLTALPALMSPLPDTLQSPTVLPCMPLTPNNGKNQGKAPDSLEPSFAGVLSSCKSSGETLSNSLRQAARVPALTPRLLPAYRDWRMINMRDLGTFASPRCTRLQESSYQGI